MTTAMDYESESQIVEADADSQLHLSAGTPHQKYACIVEASGTIRLVPLERLHESELAVLEDPQLYRDTRVGLTEYSKGERVSTDWLFDDE